jgi:hypothetical protein
VPTKPIMTAQQLRDRALAYRVMAAKAKTPELGDSLIRIAEGFEALAATRDAVEEGG